MNKHEDMVLRILDGVRIRRTLPARWRKAEEPPSVVEGNG